MKFTDLLRALMVLAGCSLTACITVGPDYAQPQLDVPAAWNRLDISADPLTAAVKPGDPEVQTCLQLSGEWDYSMKVVAPDLDAYAKFLMEKVLALPVVVNVQSSFVLETVKDTTALPV